MPDLYRIDRRAAARARGLRRDLGGEGGRGDRASRRRSRSPASCSGSTSRRSGGSRRRTSRGTSDRSTRLLGRGAGGDPGGGGDRSRARRGDRRVVRGRGEPAPGRGAARRSGCASRLARSERPAEGPLTGSTYVDHGDARGLDARGGHRRARGEGREGHRLGVEEDDRGRWSASRRARSSRRPRAGGRRDPRRGRVRGATSARALGQSSVAVKSAATQEPVEPERQVAERVGVGGAPPRCRCG